MANGELTLSEKKVLLEVARKAIAARLTWKKFTVPDNPQGGLLSQRGAFVTLHKKGALRGCIGVFTSDKPLYRTVQEMALAAAFEDPRFAPLTREELDEIDIEISVLSPLKRIDDLKSIEVGKHGLYIVKGLNRGVLLPQVASEHNWDRETFLTQTCYKAGLPGDCWKGDCEVYTFTAQIFGEKDDM
nr:AmmeMemoRadiSam system protein A [Desulfobacterales bacterium]